MESFLLATSTRAADAAPAGAPREIVLGSSKLAMAAGVVDTPADTHDAGSLQRRTSEKAAALLASARAKPAGGTETAASVEVAFESLSSSAQVLAQASRTFYLLVSMDPSAADLQGGERDYEKAICTFDSWARALLSVVLPAARKRVGTACWRVLQGVLTVLQRGASLQATDVGPVEEAVSALASLEVSGAASCKRALRDSSSLVADALRELRESIDEELAEVAEAGADEDEPALLTNAAVTTPLIALLQGTVDSLDLSASTAVDQAEADVALNVLITCAQAVAAQVDTLVCACDDEELDGVQEHAASLARLLGKLHSVLAAKCGLKEHEGRKRLEASIESSNATLRALPA